MANGRAVSWRASASSRSPIWPRSATPSTGESDDDHILEFVTREPAAAWLTWVADRAAHRRACSSCDTYRCRSVVTEEPGSTPGGSNRPDSLADQTASVGSIEITATERSSAWRQFRSGRTGRSTWQTPPATRRSFSSTASGCCRAAGTAGGSSSARLATRRSLRTGRTILRPSRRPARTRTSLPRRR